MIAVVGFYQTKFGELWEKSLFDLVEETISSLLRENQLSIDQVDAIFFGNMLSGVLENNLNSAAKIAEIIKKNIPIFRVESACASGGVAFYLAKQYLEANSNKTVLVIGAEKMTDFSPEEITQALAGAASGDEQEVGLTFPGAYALMANFYLKKYGYSEENLAHAAVKNHFHGSLNKKAHFQKKITIDDVLKSAYVAYPLKVLDSSPISDGAAGLILTNDKDLLKKAKCQVEIVASEMATDSISLMERERIDEIKATTIAAKKAFSSAKVDQKDIQVAEVHDCFTIAEIFAMEDLGFWKKGEGGKRAKDQETMLGNNGKLIVNSSGGLKAAGHPVGATGVKQIGEIYLQLTNQAVDRQVKGAHFGLAHNVGGSGGTAVVTILAS